MPDGNSFNQKTSKMDIPIRLTTEEFEALLYDIYKRGFHLGTHTHMNNMNERPYEHTLKEKFNSLMYEMKLKTLTNKKQ